MHPNILLFVIGAAIVSQMPVLVSGLYLLSSGALLIMLGVVFRKRRAIYRLTLLILSLHLGFSYATAWCAGQLANWLPERLAGTDVELTGTVATLPRVSSRGIRFRFRLDDCRECWAPGELVDLAWYTPRSVEPGMRLQLLARLERPRGTANPGLFDYEAWLLSEGVIARGYVRATDREPVELETSRMEDLRSMPERFRAVLRTRLWAALPETPMRGLVTALVLGESAGIEPVDWDILSMTGTNHLLIVSGLHIGLVTAFGFRVLMLLLRGRLVAVRRWAGAGALLFAIGYGVIAGLGLPVQRALVMATIALSGVLLNRSINVATMFCYALLLVTFQDPLASMRAGFWLSFGAVFCLLYVLAGIRPVPAARGLHKVIAWTRIALSTQWIVFVGTLPLLAYCVFQVSLISFVANLVAIPWVSLTVIPPLLLAIPAYLVHAEVGDLFVGFAVNSLAVLWSFLRSAAALDWVYFASFISPLRLASGVAGVLILLAPRGLVPLWNGLVLLAALLAPVPKELLFGELEVRVIDVGQGLAVRLRSRHHVLQYDAGPRYGDGFDAGRSIVVPALRLSGHSRFIDTLIVSHADSDHAGGAIAINDALLAGEHYGAAIDGRAGKPCIPGEFLIADGLRYRFLPVSLPGKPGARENDRSCVLLVEGDALAVLLPGDIEADAEMGLHAVHLPEVDLMLAPHHGSRSSSTPAFLNQVAPRYVVFSTGYRNRFGHPDPVVVQRYLGRGTLTYNTAVDGAVTFRFRPRGNPVVTAARSTSKRFWYDAR